MKQINVIYTGLVRNKELLKSSIKDLIQLRTEKMIKRIILSTWINEIDKHNGLREFLNEAKCELIESVPPPNWSGHIWHQMKALYNALELINVDSYCLKTRPDLYIKPEFIKKLICDEDYLNIKPQDYENKVFEKKIWIPYFEITKPFYMSDECFFGKVIDLKKLVNFDASYDIIYNIDCGITHIRRFINPFVKKITFLEQYMKYAAYSGHFTPLRFTILKFNLNSNFYLSCLTVYYYILNKYFRIEGDHSSDQFTFYRGAFNPQVKINDNEFSSNFKIEKSWNPKGGHIYSYNENWLNNLFNKKIKDDFIYERLYKIYNQFINKGKLTNKNINEEGLKYKNKLNKLINNFNNNYNHKSEIKFTKRITNKIKYIIKNIICN